MYGIIRTEILPFQQNPVATLAHAPRGCAIDGFAKMPLRASIFAHGIIATTRLLYFNCPFSRPRDGQPKKTANYAAKQSLAV